MKFVVGKADEIPPGSRKIVRVEGRSIGVFNVEGQFYAIRNRCPHQGAPLCEGKLWGALSADVPGSFQYSSTKDIIACIQHGWEFSIRTGQSWCDPKRLRVRSYEISVEQPEQIEPDLPTAPDDRVKNPMIKDITVHSKQAAAAATEAPPSDDPDAPAPGMVKGPYAVETYQVAVEDGYLYLIVDVADVPDSRFRRGEVVTDR
jgi:3-phenylpropionate/trans-cinnamate dioxygenase ferredoxin subunit